LKTLPRALKGRKQTRARYPSLGWTF